MEESSKRMTVRVRNVVLALIFLILVFLISFVAASMRMSAAFGSIVADLVENIIMVPAVLALFFVFSKMIEKKSLSEMALLPTGDRILKFFYGTVIGVAMAFIVYLVNLWTGAVVLTRIDGSISLAGGIIVYFFISLLMAFWMTVAVRGYALQHLSDGIGMHLSAIILALVIGLFRLTCPFVTFLYLSGVSFYILFLNYSYFYSRDIYLPFGLFFGWLWIANIFFSKTLYNIAHVHSLLSGRVKFEEGLVAMIVSIIGIIILLYLLRERKKCESLADR